MSGISIAVDVSNFDHIFKRLKPLLDLDAHDLMSTIGAIGESQTRRRISDEKTAPDGTPWKENSAGTSILMQTGQHLLGSIAWSASASEAEWGAGWEYAHVHQDGMTIVPKNGKTLVFSIGGKVVHAQKVVMPARPFVGISDDNASEILDIVTDYLGIGP